MKQPISIPVTLRPRRLKTISMLLLGIVFVAGGILMIRDGDRVGYFPAAFFGLGLIVFVIQLFPNAAYLQIDESGFTFCSLYRKSLVRWEDVQEFVIVSNPPFGLRKMVGFNFTPEYRARFSATAVRKTMLFSARAIGGCEGALPDTYGLKARDLAEWLDELRLQHGASRRAGS